MTTPRMPRRRIAWLSAIALPLLLAACASQTPPPSPDPLTVETAFSSKVANPGGVEGELFGVLLRPFESIGKFATEDIGAFRNAFADATLAADGSIEGRFIAPQRVPRINEGLFKFAQPSFRGSYDPWLLFFPPSQCPMDATNPDDAALAALFEIGVWDGETLIGDEFPAVSDLIETTRYDEQSDMDTFRATWETMVPVVSRTAWSAATDGACTYTRDDFFFIPLAAADEAHPSLAPTEIDVTYDVDIDLEVGWKFLHIVFDVTETAAGVTESMVVRTLAVSDVDDLSDVWQLASVSALAESAPPNPAFERLFR